MKDKSAARKCIRKLKGNIDFLSISDVINKKLISLPELNRASCVMLYMALSDEVDITSCFAHLNNHGVKCCFPVVCGDKMFVRLYDETGFRTGSYGICEPVGDFINPQDIDIIIVPGMSFDTNCMRLGRGKGFYDRFLDSKTFKIGVCPDVLCFDSIPFEAHDVPVDMVITEKRMIQNGCKKQNF